MGLQACRVSIDTAGSRKKQVALGKSNRKARKGFSTRIRCLQPEGGMDRRQIFIVVVKLLVLFTSYQMKGRKRQWFLALVELQNWLISEFPVCYYL